MTKRTLGINYVLGTGVVMSALFVPALARPRLGTPAASFGAFGLLAAVGLAGTGVWLRTCRLHDNQIWRVATHVSLGIGVLTIANLMVLQADTVARLGSTESTILASSIVIGGAGGAVLGVAREFEHSTRTLTQSTEVLARALRHNLRNDMTVILGQLDELEANVPDSQRRHVRTIRRKIDDMVILSEQAQQIEAAVTDNGRRRHPIDAVSYIERRVQTARAAHPDVSIDTDLPESAWVSADWMLGTAIENVLETAITNGGVDTELAITVHHPRPDWTTIRIVDVGGHLPAAELEPLTSGTETPLQHSEGLGLWLVNWIVDGFGGRLELEQGDDVSVVSLRLRRAVPTPREREVN